MGTNYYWTKGNTCECCKRAYASMHIGKSSGGWCFSLHVSRPGSPPEESHGVGASLPFDLAGWVELFNTPGSEIRDEYGNLIDVAAMLRTITERRGSGDDNDKDKSWYRSNNAMPGPYGLVRHNHAYGHYGIPGPETATYDYAYGEFG